MPAAKNPEKKQPLLPKLRFPDFRDNGDWCEGALSDLAAPVKKRAKDVSENNVLTLSAEHGIVRQTDYFGKQIAGKNLERYLKIQKNDFVYNDRTTSASKFGTIKRLKDHSVGAVSPIYKCFRFHADETPNFWDYYFEADAHEVALGEHVNEGARAGRFNISIGTFLSIIVRYPESHEQQKIADCLGSLDDLITAHSAKRDALESHKKGLLQQLFPAEGETTPTLRFPEFEDGGEWEEWTLGDRATIKKGKGVSKAEVVPHGSLECIRYGELYTRYSEIISEVISRTNTPASQLVLSREDDVIIPASGETKIDIATASCIRSAGVAIGGDLNIIRCDIDGSFLSYYLNGQKKMDIARRAQGVSVMHLYPSQLEKLQLATPRRDEQQRIAVSLGALDALISTQTEQIAALKEHKKGLLQRLFPNPALNNA